MKRRTDKAHLLDTDGTTPQSTLRIIGQSWKLGIHDGIPIHLTAKLY
jgi:hypothetical protein